jgi:hypothetical protein
MSMPSYESNNSKANSIILSGLFDKDGIRVKGNRMKMDTSYSNTIEADDYLVNSHGADDWFLLNDVKKEALLVKATRQIDRLRFKYFSSTTVQLLKCPLRTMDLELGDGFDQAKEATIIQAYFLLQYDEIIQEANDRRIHGFKEDKTNRLYGSISGNNSMTAISPAVIQLMGPFIDMKLRAV